MPTAVQTFQGMAPQQPQQGPFSDYLRPVQPRPIDATPSPDLSATGYENGPVAAGKIALGFLQGIRKQRVASFLEQDRNVGAQIQNYQDLVNGHLTDPDSDLTPDGRALIRQTGHNTMAAHTSYETKDVNEKTHGPVINALKNIFVGLSGGPIAHRQPLDWNTESGKISQIATDPQYNQKTFLNDAYKQASQAVDQFKLNNGGLNPSAPEVQQIIAPFTLHLAQTAPKYAQLFHETMLAGHPELGTAAWGVDQSKLRTAVAPQVPATPAPPQAPPGLFPEYAADQPMATQGLQPNDPQPAHMTAPPPGAPAAPAQDVEYDDEPRQFSIMSMLANEPRSGVKMGPPHPVIHNGRRTMGMVTTSINPKWNGYWDPQAQHRMKGSVIQDSIEGGTLYPQAGTDILFKTDPASGHLVPATYEDPVTHQQVPFRRSFSLDSYTDTYGDARLGTRSEASGHLSGAQGMQNQRTAEERRQKHAAAMLEADNRLTERDAKTNNAADALTADIQKGAGSINMQNVTALGMPMTPEQYAEAIKQPGVLLQQIARSRSAALARNQAYHQQEIDSVNQNYPAVQTAAPPGATAAPGNTAQPPPAPPAGGTGSIPVPSATQMKSLRK